MHTTVRFESMSDDALLAALGDAVGRGRRADADVVAHIAAVDARRLYLGRGHSSMFGYATEVLRMSEGAAYTRIAAARAARKHPVLLEMLADGRLHLTGIARLASHLTADNCDAVLARAVHRSKRQIEELIAELAPKDDVPAAIRKLPAPRAARAEPTSGLFDHPSSPAVESTLAPAPAPATVPKPVASKVVPLAPARYQVQFTASAELTGKFERLTNELRHQVPDGDLATLIDLAVSEKLAAIDKQRYAKTGRARAATPAKTPASRTRHIPAAVRRAVRERDGDRCTFVAEDGRRCSERGGLEFHHKDPFARGGAHSTGNVTLVCRSHNGYLAVRDFGAAHMDRFRSRAEEPRARYRAATTPPGSSYGRRTPGATGGAGEAPHWPAPWPAPRRSRPQVGTARRPAAALPAGCDQS
jgi:5-methylcytosine-specific restriction endonuclease McrA